MICSKCGLRFTYRRPGYMRKPSILCPECNGYKIPSGPYSKYESLNNMTQEEIDAVKRKYGLGSPSTPPAFNLTKITEF